MTIRPSTWFVLMAICAVALFGLGRAALSIHKRAVSPDHQPGEDAEPSLNLAGTIGPAITAPIVAHKLHLTVPINSKVKKGDVIGTEVAVIDLTDLARARQEMEDAGWAERQAAEAVRQVEEQLASVESQIGSMDRDEVQAGMAELDAEREFERRGGLVRSGLLSRFEYDASVIARASAEAAIDSLRSSVSEASIDTDELEARALEAKAELREATVRRTAAAMILQRMRALETKPILAPADGYLVVSALGDGPGFGIASDGQLFAYAMVREADLTKVRIGQEASIALDEQPAATFEAQLIAIGDAPVDTPDGPVYRLSFAVENQGNSWLTGVAMHVRLAGFTRVRGLD